LLLFLKVIKLILCSSSHLLYFVTLETHLLQIWVLLLVSVLNMDLRLSLFNLLVIILISNLWVTLLLNYLLLTKLLLLLLDLNLLLMQISNRLNGQSTSTSRNLCATSAWRSSIVLDLICLSRWNQILAVVTHIGHYLLHLRLDSKISRAQSG
jgi:hypothetical protein